jgi:hypothetical protein
MVYPSRRWCCGTRAMGNVMGADIVDLHGKPVALVEDHSFVVDLARFRENLLDEKAIRKKYRLADDVWEKLADDDELIRKVEEESIRRIRDGSSKRELAQKHIVRGPDILNGIMSGGSDVSPKHKIDAIRTLDGMAANSLSDAPGQADRFIITINLSADGAGGEPKILHFDKSLKPDVSDSNDTDTMSWEMSAASTAKSEDDGDGQPV